MPNDTCTISSPELISMITNLEVLHNEQTPGESVRVLGLLQTKPSEVDPEKIIYHIPDELRANKEISMLMAIEDATLGALALIKTKQDWEAVRDLLLRTTRTKEAIDLAKNLLEKEA